MFPHELFVKYTAWSIPSPSTQVWLDSPKIDFVDFKPPNSGLGPEITYKRYSHSPLNMRMQQVELCVKTKALNAFWVYHFLWRLPRENQEASLLQYRRLQLPHQSPQLVQSSSIDIIKKKERTINTMHIIAKRYIRTGFSWLDDICARKYCCLPRLDSTGKKMNYGSILLSEHGYAPAMEVMVDPQIETLSRQKHIALSRYYSPGNTIVYYQHAVNEHNP